MLAQGQRVRAVWGPPEHAEVPGVRVPVEAVVQPLANSPEAWVPPLGELLLRWRLDPWWARLQPLVPGELSPSRLTALRPWTCKDPLVSLVLGSPEAGLVAPVEPQRFQEVQAVLEPVAPGSVRTP